MAQNIKLKRSAVSGKVPTAAQLAAGELAINTVDGKLYFERDDATIQTIVTTNALITGSLNINGSITGSDVKVDDWGSVSASLSAISSNASALTLQDVTDNGNITTNDITVGYLQAKEIVTTRLTPGMSGYFRTYNGSGGIQLISSGSSGTGVGDISIDFSSYYNGIRGAQILYRGNNLNDLNFSVTGGDVIRLSRASGNISTLKIDNTANAGTGRLDIGGSTVIEKVGLNAAEFYGLAASSSLAVTASYALTAAMNLDDVTDLGATTTNAISTGPITATGAGAGISGTFTRTNGQNFFIISSQGGSGTNYGEVKLVLRDYSNFSPQDATISYGGAGTDSLVFTTALGASFYITGQPTDQLFVFSKTSTSTSSLYWSNSATPFITKQGTNQTVFNGNATSATSASYAANATTAVSATTAVTSSYYSGDRLGVGTPTPLASIHIKSGSEAQLLIETDSPFDAGLGYSAGIRFKVEDSDAYDRAKGGIFFVNNSPNNEDWGRGDLILASNIVNNNSNVVPDDWRLKIDRAGDVHIKGNLIITGSVSGNSATATDADKLDGQHGSYYQNASNINAGTIDDAYLPNSISSDITGNAATATALTAGNKTISGDLTVTGTVTAQEFHTEFVSASIVFESGSTQFGNSDDDTHTFTGTAVLKTSDVTIGNKPVYASDSSTVIVGTVDTTVSDVAFLDYVLISGANRRAGSLAVTWYNGTDVEWNDTSTYDIGSTAGIEFSPNYNGTDIDIALVIPSGTWTIKGHLRYL